MGVPLVVEVDVTCDAPVAAFVASETVMADQVRLAAGGAAIEHRDGHFELPPNSKRATYRIDLRAVARAHADIDVAYEAEGEAGLAWIAAVSTWILRPHPLGSETEISIGISIPAGMQFATGMRKAGNRYELLAREIRFATYGVFGTFARETMRLPGPLSLEAGAGGVDAASLRLITLPGGLATTSEERSQWMQETATAISAFWHGFPVSDVMVVLVPTPGHAGVAHGKVVAAGGPSVAIHIGALARAPDLYADWILVHELFHLGFPSFSGEGKWLDEGLATYFEPIIRARAGWHSPHAVWSEFERDMSQGLTAVEATGVEKATSFQGIYWGGAILALMADVRTRQRTAGAVGLEDGLRAVLAAGGNASRLWKLDRAIDVIDARLGEPTLRKLADAHSFAGKPVDLPRLWTELGVRKQAGEVVFDEAAALAGVRQTIIHPR